MLETLSVPHSFAENDMMLPKAVSPPAPAPIGGGGLANTLAWPSVGLPDQLPTPRCTFLFLNTGTVPFPSLLRTKVRWGRDGARGWLPPAS